MAAAVSAPNSPSLASPPLKGIKKVFSNHRRSSEATRSDLNLELTQSESLGSEGLGRKPSRRFSSHSSPSRESLRSSRNSISKLFTRNKEKKTKRFLDEDIEAIEDDFPRGRGLGLSTSPSISLRPEVNSQESIDKDSILLTDDSEIESPPPLISRPSHHGYLTTSSPAVRMSIIPVDETPETHQTPSEFIPTFEQPNGGRTSPSPKSPPQDNPAKIPALSSLPGPTLLHPDMDPEETVRRRSKSPARKFRDVFKSGKSPRSSPKTSPERSSTNGSKAPEVNGSVDLSTVATGKNAERSDTVIYDPPERKKNPGPALPPRAAAAAASQPTLPPRAVASQPTLPPRASIIQTSASTDNRPMTPPTPIQAAPLTTITPPTPTEKQAEFAKILTESPDKETDSPTPSSAPANTISHRRTRSNPSNPLPPSKLSTSTTAPLTPTEEVRIPSSGTVINNRTASGGFFSSWMTVAQNAATSISGLAGQNRSRSSTATSESSTRHRPIAETIKEEQENTDSETPKKQSTIDTLGSGDLNFEHLGIDASRTNGASPPGPANRNDVVTKRDEASAKVEDMLAKRAVSAAYEGFPAATPIVELSDPIPVLRQMPSSGAASGDVSPPNGSLKDEPGALNRSSSVRSKMQAKRRSRGSSAANGHSAIGAMVGSTAGALVNPTNGTRAAGYTTAPKPRNRAFHQQFRSVPEDDSLIEDYSSALQREIILAGRIYISEGHICFSSNILGWVTNLVISFDEIVSIEKENTALVIPNAIAIQTLHQRHVFRSLLSREATYDLMIAIWKVSHPASFQKSVNGKQMAADEAAAASAAASTVVDKTVDSSSSSEDGSGSEDSDSEGDDDDGSDGSLVGSGSPAASEKAVEGKSLSRKPSNMSGNLTQESSNTLADVVNAPTTNGVTPAAATDGAVDFPGPATHGPTECTDGATHYEKILKDEVIQAPLGKIYSLVFGPQSGVFVKKFLSDDSKCTDVVFEDDKKGLNNENKTRGYTYIKPLGGSIGPKQTKCITTETLDFFDLEKAVSVTCATQTPDVPSGNAFTVKTRYCLTWAPGNATRFQMNCGIEWSAKSWLKGPIENGANAGQQTYGDTMVKVLRASVGGRARGATSSSNKASKSGKKKRKGEKKSKDAKVDEEHPKTEVNWGVFEPVRAPLSPVVNIVKPVFRAQVILGLCVVLILYLYFHRPSHRNTLKHPFSDGPSIWSHPDRMIAYEELWRKEESELWSWLETRAGIDTIALKQQRAQERVKTDAQREKTQLAQRQKLLKSKDVETRLREEKMSEREMTEAIRVTKERLMILEGVLDSKRAAGT